jgi:hypothetical protein
MGQVCHHVSVRATAAAAGPRPTENERTREGAAAAALPRRQPAGSTPACTSWLPAAQASCQGRPIITMTSTARVCWRQDRPCEPEAAAA